MGPHRSSTFLPSAPEPPRQVPGSPAYYDRQAVTPGASAPSSGDGARLLHSPILSLRQAGLLQPPQHTDIGIKAIDSCLGNWPCHRQFICMQLAAEDNHTDIARTQQARM